ncbi:bifunctional riboflavin kinase/FAD synthetase [Actibacterium sp. 188UL27-1]|uniref:bifunctional riboflavin kinase/FAD synthetase n=1 Tax=Actibacterium sp. 188UL27-1 TaxID=2786961 RepID=UPI001959B00A|nr:bifunctional riboflavin kinase/FAD synthetase [Actibacterium sp. 188UL27-1]MBM7068712.1 bifunctional riboflavin kinase/FAD synthetase [Actibacterium sp. 188UL27-1]
MRIIRHLSEVTDQDRGTAAAIGNFDGVHLGHQAVIERARRPERALGVLTFEPHPREAFAPDAPPFRLMDARARAHRLEKLGVDLLFELPFDGVRYLNDQDFCAEVLVRGLGVSNVTVGADFRFGAGRTGSVDTLIAAGATLGFGVTISDLVLEADHEVSSTAIRAALTKGDPGGAAAMLGHWHRIEGPVQHGEKRGRELGYPTANMSMAGRHLPKLGVYAVRVDVLSGPHQGSYGGAASLGVRPMFGENQPNLETFIFDFSGDLYGAELSVALVDFLRPEIKFDGLDPLIAQMAKDCEEARQRLAAL